MQAEDSGRGNVADYSVSELSFALKRTVEENFSYVRVRGEVSGWRGPHSSGHAYFSLKDDKARIDAVIWRPTFQRLKVKPQEGLEVIATGRLTTFPGSSKYQIVIDAIEPAGVGALMALLEERRRKLTAEGLFDEARKRPLPFLPAVIGVVTSPTGAVIRDILHRIRDRFPVRVIVWPVRVQGEGSGDEVAAAIRGFDALDPGGPVPRPDVLIVARGGGSLEDLWGFNDEAVVRAAAACRIPLISAIGHETDWTLIDLAADRRAPTPTGAAEMAVPVRADLLATVADFDRRLEAGIGRRLETARGEVRSLARALPAPGDLVALPRQRLDLASARLTHALGRTAAVQRSRFDRTATRLTPRLLARLVADAGSRTERLGVRLDHALGRAASLQRSRLDRIAPRLTPRLLERLIAEDAARMERLAARLAPAFATGFERRAQRLTATGRLLETLSHRAVLARGYAIVHRGDGSGPLVRTASELVPGMALAIRFADGVTPATVTGDGAAGPAVEPGLPAAAAEPATAAPARKRRAPRRKTDTPPPEDDGTPPPAGQGSLF